MIVVTGATGHLGRLVVEGLLKKLPAREIAAAVRSLEKASDLAARGVELREADYSRPETLGPALAGAEKVLLVSSSEVGKRAAQHAAVIDAARRAGVALLAYTSILHGEASKLRLAVEHQETERALRGSGLPWAFLRNGWYLENYTENLGPALERGAVVGCAGNGRVAGAARVDYADAAVAVLTAPEPQAGKIYELAGDERFTMADLAAEVSRRTGRTLPYRDLRPEEYRAMLAGAGVPGPYADLLVDSDLGVAAGELDDTTGTLRRLIGRPTTRLADAVAAAL
jgi:NAD(P)H dehydrogenase (quinone)